MDIEKTMRLVVAQQAQLDERLARAAELDIVYAARAEREMAELRAELDRAEQFYRSIE
jgi:hypothetical protein